MTTYRGYVMPEPRFGAINDGRFGYHYSEWSWQRAVDKHIENEALTSGRYETDMTIPIMCSTCGVAVFNTQLHDDWHGKED